MPAEERAELAAQGRKSVTVLEAANSAAAGLQRSPQCEVSCSRDSQQLWRDRLGSPALQLAGSRHFAAATLANGTLQARPPRVSLVYVRDRLSPAAASLGGWGNGKRYIIRESLSSVTSEKL